VRTRQSRSSSAATDPDLRQVALGHAALASSGATTTTSASMASGSPASSSSMEPFSNQSTQSTAPSSAIWSSTASARGGPRPGTSSPKIRTTGLGAGTVEGNEPPRTPTGELITPALASSMVQQAQKQLLAYDPTQSDASSQPSLSEQLAAYGQTLAVERQVKRAAAAQQQQHGVRQADHRHSLGAGTPVGYSYEKLAKDGSRTPVARTERLRAATPSGLGLGYRASGSSYQQGPLDRRRPSAPTLRQDHKRALSDPFLAGSLQAQGTRNSVSR
jgi:hypothetical protein